MGSLARALAAMMVVVASGLAALWASISAVVTPLAVVTALVMGGTSNSLGYTGPTANTPAEVADYLQSMGDRYIAPSAGPIDHYLPVYTPEQFWPVAGTMTFNRSVAAGVSNLNACLIGSPTCVHNPDYPLPDDTTASVVFGYSQSARIATLVKRGLIKQYEQVAWVDAPELSFVVIGNPNRPNGGFLQRFSPIRIPILDVTADGATPTDSGCDDQGSNCHLPTADISWQYDGWSDFPVHPLNLLSVVNAFLGIVFEHSTYDVAISEENLTSGAIVSQGVHQDTHYYMIPAKTLPLLRPLAWLLPAPLITALDAPLRTMIEMGYERAAGPGTPMRARWFRFSPIRDLITIGIAVATGIDDALAQATGNPAFRPLRTTPAGMFGVPEFRFNAPAQHTVAPQDRPQPPALSPDTGEHPEGHTVGPQGRTVGPQPETTGDAAGTGDDAAGEIPAAGEEQGATADGDGTSTGGQDQGAEVGGEAASTGDLPADQAAEADQSTADDHPSGDVEDSGDITGADESEDTGTPDQAGADQQQGPADAAPDTGSTASTGASTGDAEAA